MPQDGRVADECSQFVQYVADVRRGTVRRLTGNVSAEDVEPAWSPDGRRLVWASGSAGKHDLFVMTADGARKRRVAQDAAEVQAVHVFHQQVIESTSRAEIVNRDDVRMAERRRRLGLEDEPPDSILVLHELRGGGS